MLVCACPQHTQECTIIFISYMQYCISYSLYTGLHVQCVVVCVWFYCCLVLQGLAVRRVPILCTKQENLYSSHWPWWRRTEPSPSLPCTFTSYDCYATYTATTHCCIQTTAAAVLLSSLHTWSRLQRDWNQSFSHIDHDFNTKDFLQLNCQCTLYKYIVHVQVIQIHYTCIWIQSKTTGSI